MYQNILRCLGFTFSKTTRTHNSFSGLESIRPLNFKVISGYENPMLMTLQLFGGQRLLDTNCDMVNATGGWYESTVEELFRITR